MKTITIVSHKYNQDLKISLEVFEELIKTKQLTYNITDEMYHYWDIEKVKTIINKYDNVLSKKYFLFGQVHLLEKKDDRNGVHTIKTVHSYPYQYIGDIHPLEHQKEYNDKNSFQFICTDDAGMEISTRTELVVHSWQEISEIEYELYKNM